MKLHILGVAIVALVGSVSPAQAVYLSSNGSGQVLLFPYYTVNSENQTLISIVNTTDHGKATRLFFREGRNSRVAMELTVYLAPYDVWTGSVFSLAAGGPANLLTVDNSCTVPALKTNASLPQLSNGNRYAPFSNAAYSGANNDAGPDDIDRTREGHFELIELGHVTNATRASLAALTHGANGIPANCAQLELAWATGGYWAENAFADMEPPGGGLYGSAYYIDALGGTMQTVAADALEDFSGVVLNVAPGRGLPTLANANSGGFSEVVSANLVVDGVPVVMQYPFERGVDAVSAVLMANQIHNEFVTGASVGGASEWVVTFPTKHFYTDVGSGPAIAPFTHVFSTATGETVASAPIEFAINAWSREGLPIECIPPFNYYGCIIGVPPLLPSRLGWASNVVSFNPSENSPNSSAILGSSLNFIIYFLNTLGGGTVGEGAIRMSLSSTITGAPNNQHLLRADLDGRRLRGLPAHGFWVASYTNGQLTPGVLSNYSDAVRHQTQTSTTQAPL